MAQASFSNRPVWKWLHSFQETFQQYSSPSFVLLIFLPTPRGFLRHQSDKLCNDVGNKQSSASWWQASKCQALRANYEVLKWGLVWPGSSYDQITSLLLINVVGNGALSTYILEAELHILDCKMGNAVLTGINYRTLKLFTIKPAAGDHLAKQIFPPLWWFQYYAIIF